ncbi:MAG TPA: hypothetical protein VE990_11550 [Acidimicrobiales bacterium]|nr:hypothetical protein [Acidimicrobiales bacterium]
MSRFRDLSFTKKAALLAAGPAAGALAYAGIALASPSTVSSTQIGSGNASAVTHCNVSETYTTAWKTQNSFKLAAADSANDNPAGYYVTDVTTTPAGGSDNGLTECAGLTYHVTVTGADPADAALEEVTNTFANAGAGGAVAVTDHLATPLSPASVYNVYAVVQG